MNKLPNLDALRFVLASLVILFHIPQLSKNQGLPYFSDMSLSNRGTEAVYMFFVLSGFLIVRIIYNSKRRGTFSIRNFYMRRMLRIFPLYYLIVFFGFFFYWILLPLLNIPFENNYEFTKGFLLAVFLLPNILDVLYMPGGILEILWSIGIEEQFYIIIAPLLYIIKTKRMLLVLVVLTVAYFTIFYFGNFPYLKTFNFVFFFIFSGGIVALLEELKYLEFLKTLKAFPVMIFGLVVLFFTTDFLFISTPWLQNLLLMILFGLFVHTLAHNHLNLIVKNKTLNYLGRISYGIYMYHIIAMNLVVYCMVKLRDYKSINDIILLIFIYILTFTMTILMAHVSYRYFELRFLNLKSRFRS